jgi:hypothetical protein
MTMVRQQLEPAVGHAVNMIPWDPHQQTLAYAAYMSVHTLMVEGSHMAAAVAAVCDVQMFATQWLWCRAGLAASCWVLLALG